MKFIWSIVPLVGVAVLSFIFVIKKRSSRVYYELIPDASNKTFVITGGNSGIGFETAKALAKRNATVILACRDMAKGNEASRIIIDKTKNSKVFTKLLDLGSFESVRNFAHSFRESGQKIDGLILNAGIGFCPKMTTKDGLEAIFAVNHLGHFLLVNELIDLLNQNSARIVVVSSSLHKRAELDFNDLLREEQPYDARKSYANSKLANLLFSYELQRRLDKLPSPHATINVVHPGVVATGLGRHASTLSRFIFRNLIVPFIGTTADEGAQSSIYCVLAPELEKIGGKYFGQCKEKPSAPQSYDEEAARKLWDASVTLTGCENTL